MSIERDFTYDAEPVCEGPVVTLVMRARDGHERAWAALVERYAPLIWSLCRRYRLDATDTAPSPGIRILPGSRFGPEAA